MSMLIARTSSQRSGPRRSKKLCNAAWLRPLTTRRTRPVSWLAFTVKVLMPAFVGDLIDTDVEHALETVEMIGDDTDHNGLHGFP